jgi:hypothetical protein
MIIQGVTLTGTYVVDLPGVVTTNLSMFLAVGLAYKG